MLRRNWNVFEVHRHQNMLNRKVIMWAGENEEDPRASSNLEHRPAAYIGECDLIHKCLSYISSESGFS